MKHELNGRKIELMNTEYSLHNGMSDLKAQE